MPEGPEIWRTADLLNKALSDKEIVRCFFAFEKLKVFEDKLIGQKVEGVVPRGKALVTFFDNDFCIYSHNQLYGKWMVSKAGEIPDTTRSLRLALHNKDKTAWLYSASEIQVMRQEQIEAHDYIKKLGPDVVHPSTSIDEILGQYEDETFQNRKLTTLLLDQAFLSGVGNYLRSEILFYAGVSPFLKLADCTRDQKQKLAEATRLLARRSYKTKGITNAPKTVEALKRENVKRPKYRFYAYSRTDDYCYRCGSQIKEDKTGGRKIYYCSSCQAV